MGKRSKKKRKLRRLQKLRRMQAAQNQPQLAPAITPETDVTPSLTLEDSDAVPPKSPEASEIKKIALLMTALATIVVCVAILNAQTPYILDAGQVIMKFLKISN